MGITTTTSTAAGCAGMTKGKRAGFPAAYKALPPAGRLAWLRGDECKAMIRAGRIHSSAASAERDRIEKDLARVGRIVPTDNWLAEHKAGRAFPPRADDAANQMREADHVFHADERPVLWPAAYLSGEPGDVVTYDLVCYETDCRRRALGMDDRSTVSPSVAALDYLAESGGRLAEAELLTEDAATLQRQIDRYRAGQKTTLMFARDDRVSASPPAAAADQTAEPCCRLEEWKAQPEGAEDLEGQRGRYLDGQPASVMSIDFR